MSRLRRGSRMLPVLAFVAVAAVAAPVRGVTQADLERKRAQIAEAKAALDRANQQYSAALARLSELQNRLNEVRGSIEGTEERLDDLREQLRSRARAVYVTGPGTTLELLLSSETFTEFNDRLYFLDRIAEQDRMLALHMETTQRQLAWNRDELVALSREQREAAEKLDALREQVTRQLDALSAELEDLEARYRAELAAAAARAEAATGGDPGQGGGGPNPFSSCPVQGGGSFTDDFGDPRVGHTHQGIDILAPKGTPVLAAHAGTFQKTSSSLGGISAYVKGSRGFTYYAHLDGYSGVSGSVSAGTVIGYVGSTGNAGNVNHLHFEWHPGGGAAVNPYQYLLEVC